MLSQSEVIQQLFVVFTEYSLQGDPKDGSLELEEVMREIQDTFPPDANQSTPRGGNAI